MANITAPPKPIPFILVTALGLALAGCTSAGGPTASAPPSAALGHVHGLGVDTMSGETYVASHNGVWLVPTDELPSTFPVEEPADSDAPRQIADRAQDTMGFVVGRPGLLLGSGHPDPKEQPDLNPPNLGLISSTDGANTWTTVSLRGQTDFHDMDTAELADGELRIFGYDSTAAMIRVSSDTGASWTDGARLELRDLASDPANPDRLYATTAKGLMVSDDLGVSFRPVADAPALYLITLTDTSSFVGIDTSGVIWTSDGTSWTEHGTTDGPPEALEYVGGEEPWLLIADERGVVATNDYGKAATVLLTNEG